MANFCIKTIKNYCGENIFNLAKEYLTYCADFFCYKEDQKHVIRAFCQELNNGYKVNIYYENNKIINSICSCKENIKGPCKHIAAILLISFYNPESIVLKNQLFNQIEILSDKIFNFCKEQLADINSPVFQLSAIA